MLGCLSFGPSAAGSGNCNCGDVACCGSVKDEITSRKMETVRITIWRKRFVDTNKKALTILYNETKGERSKAIAFH
jgi:hypothetical protein